MSEQEITLDDFSEHEEGSADDEIAPPTELAKIPAGWPSIRLNDVALDTDGAFVDGPFGSNLKADEMVENGYARVVQLQNIRASEFIDSNHKYITEEKFEELERHGAKPGDLAIAKMAEPVARACLLPEIESQYLVVADCIKLSVDESEHNSRFVMFALNSRPVWKQAFARSRGSTRKRINLTQLKQVQIPSPSLPEQRKIATVLYTVDRAIENTEDVIERIGRLLTGTRRELMRSGVGKCSLAASDSRFGQLPESWDVKRLDSVAEVVGGSTPSTDEPQYWNGEIPWATPTDLTGLDAPEITETEDYITEEGLASTSTHLLPPNSVLMTSRATIGECAVNKVEMATNQGFQSLVPGESLDTWYLYHRMNEEAAYLESIGSGSTFTEVSKTGVKRVEIPVPPVEEQKIIAKKLQSINYLRLAEVEYLRQLRRLKRGLMQDLLSGTVRTTDTNIEVPEEVAQYG